MSFRVIIPSRYGSCRLPAKPLADIHGKPMVQRVYEQACLSEAVESIIATDDRRVFDCAKEFGASVLLTCADHPSGTDRIAEVVQHLALAEEDIVVNVQGDLPLVPPQAINQVARYLMEQPDLPMATLCQPIHALEDVLNPHVVKVVFDNMQHALYFSRQAIPWSHKIEPGAYYKHIGLYAYRVGFIKQYVKWPPSELEQQESLEQLRALWHGAKIFVGVSEAADSPSVDTQKDLEKVRKLLALQLESFE